jgi:multicomponent Na+:H+ antiporter subunit F
LLETVLIIAFALLSMSLILAFVRLVRGPTLPDRVVALELLVSVTVGFIAAHSIATDHASFLDVAVVLALTAFLAAVGFARFLEQGGPRDD